MEDKDEELTKSQAEVLRNLHRVSTYQPSAVLIVSMTSDGVCNVHVTGSNYQLAYMVKAADIMFMDKMSPNMTHKKSREV